MRITNKIMRNNSLENMNAAKEAEDRLMRQMSTGQKIIKPSDDPVIAIRALRLRSTLTDITQYYEKNVEEAEGWLDLTESAIGSLEDALEDMIQQCNKGANKDLQPVDRQAILDALKNLRDEIYATGEVDCAGRGLFTGYRTGTKLRFETDQKKDYDITEKFKASGIEDITHVAMKGGKSSLDKIDGSNLTDADLIDETDVSQNTVHRIRLSYDNVVADQDVMITKDGAPVGDNFRVMSISLNAVDPSGNLIDPYLYAQQLEDQYNDPPVDPPISVAILIPETGELILGNNAYKELSYSGGEIGITYRKMDWEKGDLRPEHYFTCSEYGEKGEIRHNPNGIEEQVMEYDVGFNQAVRVNTLASECYTPDIGRDIDDLISILEQVENVENTIAEMTKAVADLEKEAADDPDAPANPDLDKAKKLLAAANKALTYLNEKLQTLFESSITKMQNHLDAAGIARTNVGTRSSKLALVKDRLMSQQSNFKDLVSDNEQADEAAITTDLASARFSYNAALMATGRMTERSLLDFI